MLETLVQDLRYAARFRLSGAYGTLGAAGVEPGGIKKLVLGQAVRLTGIGLAIGVPMAFGVNRAMAALLFGIVSINFTLLASSTLVLVLVALAAAYLPARRAMRVDPIVALRYE